jgi:hypothetical protein
LGGGCSWVFFFFFFFFFLGTTFIVAGFEETLKIKIFVSSGDEGNYNIMMSIMTFNRMTLCI